MQSAWEAPGAATHTCSLEEFQRPRRRGRPPTRGTVLGHLGAILKALGASFVHACALLGPLRALLALSWGPLGALWVRPGMAIQPAIRRQF